MRIVFFSYLLLFAFFLPLNSVIINELFINPESGDNKWIELYNSSDSEVNLIEWKLESAGEEFISFYTFTDVTILPYDYLVVSAGYEDFADFKGIDINAYLSLNQTNGIRLKSPEGYTDTVLYGEPNIYSLPDDLYTFGFRFAPIPPKGAVLARIPNGTDTDNNANDWKISFYPTPGEKNVKPLDIGIYDFYVNKDGTTHTIHVVIHNLSTETYSGIHVPVELYYFGELIGVYVIEEIYGEDFKEIIFYYNFPDISYNIIAVFLKNGYVDCTEVLSFVNGKSPLVFNEILFKDTAENQEWIEFYNRSSRTIDFENFIVEDYRGRQTLFSGSIGPKDYIVVCRNKQFLLDVYKDIDPVKIVESEGWAVLNNDYDHLTLKDSFYTVLDIKEYSYGSSFPHDVTIERVNPYSENTSWEQSISIEGGTPTRRNSVFLDQQISGLTVSFSANPFHPSVEELLMIEISVPDPVNTVSCKIFDLKGRMVKVIANQMSFPAQSYLVWNGLDDENKRLKPGVYIMLLEVYGHHSERNLAKKMSFVLGR